MSKSNVLSVAAATKENVGVIRRKGGLQTRPAGRAALGDIGGNAARPLACNKQATAAAVKPDAEKAEAKGAANDLRTVRQGERSTALRAPITRSASLVHRSTTAGAQQPAVKTSYSSGLLVPNIDAADAENPFQVAEYVNDIYAYLRFLEKTMPVMENYLHGRVVTGKMRAILVDWLVQVHVRFHLIPETLFMTVFVLDRFLQATEVPKDKLQLVGVTAMFVASKYEEIYAPDLADFVYITDRSYSKDEILEMEMAVLRVLDFQLGRPLPIHFLRRFSKAADADCAEHSAAKFLMELALVDNGLCHVAPSLLAAAALCLALKLMRGPVWTRSMVFYTKYTESALVTVLGRLCSLLSHTLSGKAKQQSVRNKYGTSKFMEISKHEALSLGNVQRVSDSL